MLLINLFITPKMHENTITFVDTGSKVIKCMLKIQMSVKYFLIINNWWHFNIYEQVK